MSPRNTPTASASAIDRTPTLIVVVQLRVTATTRAPTESHARLMISGPGAWVEVRIIAATRRSRPGTRSGAAGEYHLAHICPGRIDRGIRDRGTAGGVAMAGGHRCRAAAADAGAARHLGRVGAAERRGARPARRAGPAAARRLSRHPLQRGRAPARRHVGRVDLGHAGISVPAALGAAPVARARRRPHPQGAGSAHARGARLPRAVHALARPSDLHGRPAASAGVGAAHLDRLLHRRSGWATRSRSRPRT